MVRLLGLAALATLAVACNSDLTPAGYAMFSGPERVTSARITSGFKSYGGAPLTTWTVTLSATDGCASTSDVLHMEIDVLSNGAALPSNTDIPFRVDPNNVVTLPSALFTYDTVTLTSGAINLNAVEHTRLGGTFTAQTSGGEVTGMFDGPICATP